MNAGTRQIWVVTSRYSDGSGAPEFLAAYDGEQAEINAKTLVETIIRGGSFQIVEAHPVHIWPLIQC